MNWSRHPSWMHSLQKHGDWHRHSMLTIWQRRKTSNTRTAGRSRRGQMLVSNYKYGVWMILNNIPTRPSSVSNDGYRKAIHCMTRSISEKMLIITMSWMLSTVLFILVPICVWEDILPSWKQGSYWLGCFRNMTSNFRMNLWNISHYGNTRMNSNWNHEKIERIWLNWMRESADSRTANSTIAFSHSRTLIANETKKYYDYSNNQTLWFHRHLLVFCQCPTCQDNVASAN